MAFSALCKFCTPIPFLSGASDVLGHLRKVLGENLVLTGFCRVNGEVWIYPVFADEFSTSEITCLVITSLATVIFCIKP